MLQERIQDIATEQSRRLERRLNIWSMVISAAVLILVGMMRRIKLDIGMDFSFLPPLHASLNAVTALLLAAAYLFIRKKQIHAHRLLIYAALTCSVLFLLSYVLYHFTTPETKFGGTGAIRYVYFFFLITHIVLAALVLPFVLLTFNRAFTGQYARHRKIARWVYPLWLYVAVTGPVCYLMLRPYY